MNPLLVALALSLPGLPGQNPLEVRELPCGIELTLLRVPEVPAVQGSLLIEAGAAFERADQVGLAGLVVDSLAAGGSEHRDRGAIDAALGDGAEIHLARDYRTVSFDFRCAPGALADALIVARELIEQPAHDEESLELARTALERQRVARGDDPFVVANRAIWEVACGDRVRRARLPHAADVAALTREDLLAYQREHFGANRMHLVLTGPLDGDVAEVVERVFADLPRSSPAPSIAPGTFRGPVEAGALRVVVVDLPQAPHAELRVGLPSVAQGHPVAAALQLFAHYHDLSRHRGLPSGPGEMRAAARVLFTFDDLVQAAVGVAPGDAREGVEMLVSLLRPGEESELDADRLRLAGEALRRIHEHPDPLTMARNAALRRMLGRGEEVWTRHRDAVATLGPDEVLAALRRRAKESGLLVVAVGPADVLVPQLAGLGPLELRSGLRQPRGTEEGLDLRDRLLAAVGGAGGWAGLSTLDCEGTARPLGLDPPVAVAVRRDLETRAVAIEQRPAGMPASTAISTEEGSWIRRGDTVTELPRAAHDRLRFAEERRIYTLLRDMARGRSVRVAASEAGALECWRDGVLLSWFELGEDGLPARSGYADLEGTETLIELGDWMEVGGLSLPGLVRRPVQGLENVWSRCVLNPEHDPALFVRPGR